MAARTELQKFFLFNNIINNLILKKSMKRKDYVRPTMKVVKLQHQTHLLQASTQDKEVGMRNYNVENYYEE